MNRLHVVLIDENRLRRAGIASLISSWTLEHELEIRQIGAPDVLKEFERSPTCRLVLYNVGGGSIRAIEASSVVRILHALAPHAPVIVISDREDAEEIVHAYRICCRGFIPTNMEPAVALQAISFILDGGTYFPPSALRRVVVGDSSAPGNGADGENDTDSNYGGDDIPVGDVSSSAELVSKAARTLMPRDESERRVAVGDSSGSDNGEYGKNDRDPDYGGADTPVGDHGCDSASTSAELVSKAARTLMPRDESEDLSGLTGRQHQVLQCLQKGQPNKLIARELGMTEGTVKVHVRQIMRKLGATNRTQAAILATSRRSGAVRVQAHPVGRFQ